MNDEKLEELIGDIFRMPDPQWFSDKWSRHIVYWKETADKGERFWEWLLENIDKPHLSIPYKPNSPCLDVRALLERKHWEYHSSTQTARENNE